QKSYYVTGTVITDHAPLGMHPETAKAFMLAQLFAEANVAGKSAATVQDYLKDHFASEITIGKDMADYYTKTVLWEKNLPAGPQHASWSYDLWSYSYRLAPQELVISQVGADVTAVHDGRMTIEAAIAHANALADANK